jgi:predicted DNA binding CopG/RHH family protein
VIGVSETTQKEKRLTSIRVSKETLELLKERGRKGESYDDIIRKLLEKRRR